MRDILFLIFFFLVRQGLAQRATPPADSGSIAVSKDPRLDQLVKKQIAINEETTRESRRNVPGFRIQVMNTPDRNKAYEAKAKVYQEFPDWKPYLLYQAPNYKLRVGDFKTEEEANAALQQLSRLFPAGLYGIRDVIE